VIFFVYVVSTAKVGFIFYDDGIFTTGGWLVAHGRMPYRDFWTLYNPGQFLLLGAFFRFVSESVASLRVFESLIVTASGLLTVDVCRRVFSRGVALVAGSGVVLWMGSGVYLFHETHIPTSLFLTLLSADLLLTGIPSRSRLVLAGGFCAGLCFVIRQDALPYVLLPETLAICVYAYLADRPEPRLRDLLGRYAAGAAAPIVALLAWVLTYAPTRYWQDAIVFPLIKNPGLRDKGFAFGPLDFSGGPGLWDWTERLVDSARSNLVYYVPAALAVVGLGLIVVFILRPKARLGIRNPWGFALLALLLAASLDYLRVRSDFEHAFPSVVLAFLVVPGVAIAVRAVTRPKPLRWAGAALLVLLGTFALLLPIHSKVRLEEAVIAGAHFTSGPLDGVIVDNRIYPWGSVEQATDYIRAHTSREDEIFVMSDRNDALLGNDPGFYVMAERFPATTYSELTPGVTTTAAVQREIISELEASRAPFVIRWPFACIESNPACRPAEGTEASALLDEYVQMHYTQVEDFGLMTILARDRD
jgi:hypothetical protein